MKHSKQSLEGYMLVDHSNSPGLEPEFLAHVQKLFPKESILPPHMGKGKQEMPILRCSHCQANIILSPTRNLALRPREYCNGCGRYICDKCSLNKKLGLPCKPIEKIVDEVLERAIRGDSLIWI